MAAQGKSQSERIARWELIEKALDPLVAEMPYLADAHAELQRKIGEARQMEREFEQLRASWRELSERRKKVLKEGDDLRLRMAGVLKFKHGLDSQRLLEFGLAPRRTRGRGKKSRGPEPTPPPVLPSPAGGTAARVEDVSRSPAED